MSTNTNKPILTADEKRGLQMFIAGLDAMEASQKLPKDPVKGSWKVELGIMPCVLGTLISGSMSIMSFGMHYGMYGRVQEPFGIDGRWLGSVLALIMVGLFFGIFKLIKVGTRLGNQARELHQKRQLDFVDVEFDKALAEFNKTKP